MIQTSRAQASSDDDDENLPDGGPINLVQTEHVVTRVLNQVGKKTPCSTHHWVKNMSDQDKKNFNAVMLDYLS